MSRSTLWVRAAATGLPTGFALCLYWFSAAPGLTWAHHGADGGDFIAAALVNGVPHPSGYPLYTLLLRAWLELGQLFNQWFALDYDAAYWGNRLSAICAAGAVGITVLATASLLREDVGRWLWAMIAGLIFAVTPLVWSQALITEVYGLHTLLVALLGWLALWRLDSALPLSRQRTAAILLGLVMGFGAANHLTSLLLWPALIYWWLRTLPWRAWLGAVAPVGSVALLVTLAGYGYILWRTASATEPLPVAWGYPRDPSGLWWLVSGTAYRPYVFNMTPLEYAGRLASLARLLVEQFTPVGLALVIAGFAVWDRHRPALRVGAMVWILPVSLYATGYNTVDSYIYLLPVVWIMSLMFGQGAAAAHRWFAHKVQPDRYTPKVWRGAMAALALLGLTGLVLWRLPQLELRADHAAQDFLVAAATTLEPNSLVISSSDAPTFALWYGAWGSGELARTVPDLVFVNYALYQFGWYRNLMHDLYPEIPAMGASFAELLAANQSLRPVFTTEPLPGIPPTQLTPIGEFWRLTPP